MRDSVEKTGSFKAPESVLSTIKWRAGCKVEQKRTVPLDCCAMKSTVIYIANGTAVLSASDREGRDSFLGVLLPGDVYLVRAIEPPRDLTALVSMGYHILPEAMFMCAIEQDPTKLYAYARNVELQLERSRELFMVCNRTDITARLAALLLWFCEHVLLEQSSDQITLPFRNCDFGRILTCNQTTISRARGTLMVLGALEGCDEKSELRIRSKEILRRISETGSQIIVRKR